MSWRFPLPLASKSTYYRELRALAPGVLYIELLNVLGVGWWLFLFALPGSLFDLNPTFIGLRNRAPEYHWSLVFLLAGALLSFALLRPYPVVRFASLLVASGVWGGVSFCLMLAAPRVLSVPVSTGIGIYGAVSAVSSAALYPLVVPALLDGVTLYRMARILHRKRRK